MPHSRTLRMGMVGGGRGAMIGAIHRRAARLTSNIELIAGALSSTPEKSLASGKEIGLPDDRNYPDWQSMLENESRRKKGDRIDFVTIVTPNYLHFEVASAFATKGFHLVIDKPMVTSVSEAEQLAALIKKHGVIGCVMYNYSGFPMIKQARAMVQAGELGEIRKVLVEYNQGWLATLLEKTGHKQASWRTDPDRAGEGGAIGDIGSHAEQLMSYVTGLEIDSLCADLTPLVKGRQLDDDANVLLRFTNGARGVLVASQICVGERNNFRLRVWGTKAGLEWHQEEPNVLAVRPLDEPEHLYHRGEAYLVDAAKHATELPPGHPDAFIEAFANVYRGAAAAMLGNKKGSHITDYPTVDDGVRGVKFIHAAVASSNAGGTWVSL